MNHPLISTYAQLMTSSTKLLASISMLAGKGEIELTRKECEIISAAAKLFFDANDTSRSNDAFDDALGRESGPCADLANYLSQCYGAEYARIGTAGSSVINYSIGAVLTRYLGAGCNVLLDGGSHLSMIGGLSVMDISVQLVHRKFNKQHGVQLPLTAPDIKAALLKNPNINAVIITSPIYDGSVARNFADIRDVCHAAGALLIVDAAWGAQFGLVEGFPLSPAKFADMTTISLHKKGFGVSQLSLALFNDQKLVEAFDDCATLGTATTSPAFFMLQALEAELLALDTEAGQQLFSETLKAAEKFSGAMEKLPGISRIRFEELGDFESDPLHLLFDTRETGWTGYEIQKRLRDDKKWNIEMATITSVLLLFDTKSCDLWSEMAADFYDVLNLDDQAKRNEIKVLEPPLDAMRCEHTMTPHQAFFAGPNNIERVPLHAAAGKVAAQSLAAYPPGAAIIIPGVKIGQEAIDFLLQVQAAGSRLKGDLTEEGLAVIKAA